MQGNGALMVRSLTECFPRMSPSHVRLFGILQVELRNVADLGKIEYMVPC